MKEECRQAVERYRERGDGSYNADENYAEVVRAAKELKKRAGMRIRTELLEPCVQATSKKAGGSFSSMDGRDRTGRAAAASWRRFGTWRSSRHALRGAGCMCSQQVRGMLLYLQLAHDRENRESQFVKHTHTSVQLSLLTGISYLCPYARHVTTSGMCPLGAFDRQHSRSPVSNFVQSKVMSRCRAKKGKSRHVKHRLDQWLERSSLFVCEMIVTCAKDWGAERRAVHSHAAGSKTTFILSQTVEPNGSP
eukprot:748939-Hanusia_phi.AAC.2